MVQFHQGIPPPLAVGHEKALLFLRHAAWALGKEIIEMKLVYARRGGGQ
jgi:hypothetical protein